MSQSDASLRPEGKSEDSPSSDIRQILASQAILADKVSSLTRQLADQKSEIEQCHNALKKAENTLLDCSKRIDSVSDSAFLFPIRKRLKRIALKLGTGAESLAPARKVIPRSSNPVLDKDSSEFQHMKNRWKEEGTPKLLQQRQWLDFRRQLFAETGESERVEALRNIHAGKRCFIIGNGPSLNLQDLSLLKNEITFVSNWFVNSDRYAEVEPDYYCVSSHEMFGGWNQKSPSLNRDYYETMQKKARSSRKFFSFAFRDHISRDELFPGEDLNYLLFERPKRQVDEAGEINMDLTRHLDDGYTVIQTLCIPLAVHFGCTEIYLLGCDCDYGINKADDVKQYCYDSKLHTTSTTKFESLQKVWTDNGPVFQSYAIVGETLEKRGVKLYNATHGGRLDVLPRADYRSLFR